MPTTVRAANRNVETDLKTSFPRLTWLWKATQRALGAREVSGSQIKEILPLTFTTTFMVNCVLFIPDVGYGRAGGETIPGRGKQTRFHAAIVAVAQDRVCIGNRSVGKLALGQDEAFDFVDPPAIVASWRVPDPHA